MLSFGADSARIAKLKLRDEKGVSMKRFLCAALLASTFVVPSTFAQDAGSVKTQKTNVQAAEKAAKQKGKEGADCDTSRAGVRCNKPRPKKVWFFGKA